MTDLASDLRLAADLVREAGTLAARMLGDGLETHYKTSVSDVVSAADHAAEALIVGRLTAERPEDALVGEEGARSAGGRSGDLGRTWFVDPVDGTYNFLSGLPYWCSAVGLADADGPALGAVYYPARDERWTGSRDEPTCRDGTPVVTLTDQPLDRISVATYIHPTRMADETQRPWTAVVRQAATVRMLGSASVDLAGVATGRIGMFLQADLNDWDWVPGAALVLAAGGAAEIVERQGHRWQLAGNRQSVEQARAVILRS